MYKKLALVLIIIVILGSFIYAQNQKPNIIVNKNFSDPQHVGQQIMYGDYNNRFYLSKPTTHISDCDINDNLRKNVEFNIDNIISSMVSDFNKLIFLAYTDIGNEKLQHIQVQYKFNKSDFIILSVYETLEIDELPDKDIFNNRVETIKSSDKKYIHHIFTTNKSLTYDYYTYSKNNISFLSTVANEVYYYKDKLLYHIAYSSNLDLDNNMLKKLMHRFSRNTLERDKTL